MDTEKALDKIQHCFTIKNIQQTQEQRELLQHGEGLPEGLQLTSSVAENLKSTSSR